MVVAMVRGLRIPATVLITLLGLGVLGAVGAQLGGAPKGRAALRVLIGGAVAMAVTWAVGHVVGVHV
jgi:VIT1/CCC1 family predicted Fe2+/Mn2+ transporter